MKITFGESILSAEDTKLDGNGYFVNERIPAGTANWSKWRDESIHGIIFMCPCGCKVVRTIPVAVGPKRERFWQWDGNETEPTLQPSIQITTGCRWHGYLTKGEWITV